MKKTPDQRFMHRPSPNRGSRSLTCCGAMMLASLLLSACTTYLPLDQGARVPWAKALSAKAEGPIDGNRYRVGEGDALGRIANRYNVRLVTLAAANNIEAPYILYPGEVLRIPDDAPMPAKRPDIIQTALPPSAPAAEAPNWQRQAAPPSEPVVDGMRYVVVSGDSLALLAVRHNLTLGDLVAANKLKPPYRITPGQMLIIPEREGSRSERTEAEKPKPVQSASPLAPPPPLSGEGFLWPVDGELIGAFNDNSSKGRSGGVNIAARKGTPVRASDSGIVAYAGEALSGYGRMVMLRHAEGYVTLYAHNDVILVREGDVVNRGQPIAEVGTSGDVSDSQLHFELRKGTDPIDPTKVLAGLPGRRIGKL